ncbi:hypothetical protein ABZX62_20365 [Streptomyces flavidovirens]|uniref:hypothetical protein n=1 Tax=Streptomyces flavidovirens TaxID=67298 RepID=UPI0033BC46E7
MRLIVGYGPPRTEVTHEGGITETFTIRPQRVYEKAADGSLKELRGEATTTALAAFWADVERFNEQQEKDA